MRDQPGDLIIERLGVPGGVTGPRHRGNRHPVGRTAHPRRLSLDEHLHRAGIQRPPPAPSLTLVVTTATPTTTPTPTTGTSSQPTRHDDHLEVFVELDALHHHLMVNTDHPAPYPLRLHPLLLARLPAVDSRKAKPDNGVHPRMVSYPPTERDGEPQLVASAPGPWTQRPAADSEDVVDLHDSVVGEWREDHILSRASSLWSHADADESAPGRHGCGDAA